MAPARKADESPALLLFFTLAALYLGPTSTAAQMPSDCTDVLISLAPCLDYITGSNGNSPPSSSCCAQFANVVNTQPRCLCLAIGGGGAGADLGVNINRTQALALPKACNVQTPPARRCNEVSPQSRSHSTITPTTSTSSSSSSSSGIDIPSTGSKTLPARHKQDSSKGQTMAAPSAILLLATLFFISHSAWDVILNHSNSLY